MAQDLTPPLLSRRAALRTIGLGAAGVVILACGVRTRTGLDDGPGATTPMGGSRPATSGFEERFAEFQVADEPNGDLSKVVWPDFVKQSVGDVQQLYEFAVTHGTLLRWMACYCGCGRSDGHKSVRDCYVQQVNADGSVVFASMAPT